MPVTAAAGRARTHGFALVLLLLSHAAPAAALDELLLAVTLNEVDKGILFAYRSPEGDLLFSAADLRAIGFSRLPGAATDLGGTPHHSLRSLPGVTYEFDAEAVSVRITAPPGLLALQTIDFLAGAGGDVEYPVARSAFLNYRLNYRAGEDFAFTGFDATGEVGARVGAALLLSDGVYRRTTERDSLVRLTTRASWEDRGKLQRLTLGDFTSSPGDLWASPGIGGVSFSRLYRMNPYQPRHPTFGFAGQTPLPAELRVYLNGSLLRTEQLAPGRFEIRNLDSFGGDSGVEVVIRDAFGRETRISRPFYFTDAVLRAGLHEFSYGLGWVREGFGEEGSGYGGPALSAFHRYGVSDSFTLGLAGEAGDGVASAGPTLSLVAGSLGAFQLALSAGSMGGEAGYAGQIAHEYQGGHVSTRVRFRRSSAGYRTLEQEATADRPGAQFEAGIGFGAGSTGTLSLAYSAQWLGPGADRSRVSASYNLGLFGQLNLFATAGRTEEGATRSTDLFAGLSWFPGERRTVSAQYRRGEGGGAATLEVSRDLSEDKGLAWKASADLREDTEVVRSAAEYHGERGIWAGGLDLQRLADDRLASRLSLSAAGSLLAAGGALGLGRPVQDSFTLVKVGREQGLPGVRVYHGGGARGVTDAAGRLFVPEISAYVTNQISIEPKDIPLGYSIDRVTKAISPAERSGSLVGFDVARYQAVTGKLFVREGEGRRALEFLEIRVRAAGRTQTAPTGRDGEFFLENVGGGVVDLEFRDRGRDRSCAMVVPESEDIIVEVGEVSCEFFP